MPCRDGERYLGPLLDSLLAQTGVDASLLLVDDASVDASIQVARAVAGERIRIVRNPRPLGIPGNWNRCAELVQTPQFCLAHMDDLYEPAFAATMLRALAAQPQAVAAHCRAASADEAGAAGRSLVERYKDRFWRRLPAAEPPTASFRRLYAGNFITCPSLVFRTAGFAAVGGFDPGYRFVADWEWTFRAALHDRPLCAVAEPLLHYRRHDDRATVGAARTLERYREEQRLLDAMRRTGIARGWLDESVPPSTAMRDNLLFDAFVDLEVGAPQAARQKLALLGELDPAARRSWPARALATAMRAGAAGRAALRLGLRAYVGLHGRS